jgi:shikimate kinase
MSTENIFLVGLMGAGKTTVGKLLAKHLGKRFVDSDHEIEKRTGVKVAVIFELEGETGFRAREEIVIDELTQETEIVLATGGGVILREGNRNALHSRGTVIYLRASADDLWRRTRNDKNRPLLQTDNPRARLQELLTQRDPLYSGIAHLIADTGEQNVQKLVRHLERELAQL